MSTRPTGLFLYHRLSISGRFSHFPPFFDAYGMSAVDGVLEPAETETATEPGSHFYFSL